MGVQNEKAEVAMSYKTVMKRENKPRSGVALGGLGTGCIELRQDGQFYNWTIFNNRPLGLEESFEIAHDSMLFFLVRFQEKGKEPKIRLLQIEEDFGGAAVIDHPHYYVFPWIDGVDTIEYEASFPFVKMRFSDKEMPFIVEMEAYSPFIPHDAKNSALPTAIFNFNIISKTKESVDVMLMATMRNAVAYDKPERLYTTALKEGKGYKVFEQSVSSVDKKHGTFGTMGIASFSSKSTHYLGWEHRHPYYEIVLRNSNLPNINDTNGRNHTDKKTGKTQAGERCFSTIAESFKLKAGDKKEHSFAAVWHFPNCYAEKISGDVVKDNPKVDRSLIEGHYYDNFFSNSSDVAQYISENKNNLYKKTLEFFNAYYDSTAPSYVLDQVNSNLNTFITSSWFTKEGNFGIIEGLNKFKSFAGLSTTDVAMYGGISYAALFPELDKEVIRSHMRFQKENGIITHSIRRNFKTVCPKESSGTRLDMPSQYAYQALRAFFFSEDMDYLKEVWPSVKKALGYVLRERDKNGDMLPDMEGVMCSYDNFPMYGIAPYVVTQWLVALRSAIEVAKILGDDKAKEEYENIFDKGREAFEREAWNGKYYRLYTNGEDKDEGCLSDQIIGAHAAHLIGLGGVVDEERRKKALKYIMEKNYHKEYGLRNCTWPYDKFLHEIDENTWVDQANTAWSGVELGFTSFLLYEGFEKEALTLLKNVDDRYRHYGLYFDHQEFGGHYFRPMSAWSNINAILGLTIKNGEYSFAPALNDKNQKLFFTHANGFAHYERKVLGKMESIKLISKNFSAKSLTFQTLSSVKKVSLSVNGKKIGEGDYAAIISGKSLTLAFKKPVKIKSELVLSVS